MKQKKLKKMKPLKGDKHSEFSKTWRIVDGAVRDCFFHHPEYLTKEGQMSARISLVKRITGAIASREGKGRAGFSPAAKKKSRSTT